MKTRLILVTIVVVGTVVTLLRVPLSHLDTVWAEDGQIFLQEHLDESAWAVLVKGYAGYQHLIPRIVTALIVSVVPIDAFGVAVFIACAILTGGVAAAVFWLSRDLVEWLPARLGLAGITLLLPLSAQEVVGNLADFHSYCLWLTPWLLLYRPRSLGSGIGWGIVAFLCAMTEIQSLLFVPLLILMVRRQHRFAWPIGAGLLLGLLGQIVTSLLLPRPSTAGWHGMSSLLLGYLYNTVLPMLNPDPVWQANILLSSGALVPALVVLPFVAATIVALVWGTGRQRILVITLVLASGAVYAGGATIDGGGYFAYAHHLNLGGFDGLQNSRYGVASGFLLAATVPLAATILVRLGDERGVRWPRAVAWIALVGLMVQFALASTQSVSSRESGVTWSGNIAAARAACDSLPPETVMDIANAPYRLVKVTCAELMR
ncbi:hypothetical protein LH407_06375 [Antiquaquibacter oligotrophicus]|uniref:hypothetical protein n=1 Tax=Antiquaquibacter oligotrophicus TaxID=2880260 RepID=UPI002AC8F857|nr:hypothetical protein [Antiquaquibacter oligotrophicus]UDF14483.1 hypothetical protein LH407_06375 [Antiquaquibacter oligotrophicus]